MASIDLFSLLLFSAVFRFLLIVYGEWQDTHMEVRYTDVDYFVFSDAASLMASGKSPYERSTYRYSPLLALLLIPNSIIHRSWGKFLFSASGPWSSGLEKGTMVPEAAVIVTHLLVGLFIHTILKLRRVPENLCLCSVAVWLFNPFTFTIGTRGNCEPLVCAMILWVIICFMNGQKLDAGMVRQLYGSWGLAVTGHLLQAAFWYGLVVHFRIYPIIYALPIILVLNLHNFRPGQTPALQNWNSRQQKSSQISRHTRMATLSCSWFALRSFLTKERILFGFFSGTTFFFCTGLFFHLYGWEFLHEALLYHLTRTDPRHNFCIYFYHIYLNHQHGFSAVEKLFTFFPQLVVQLVLVSRFAQDLPFCLFVQTVAFVAFNKVITAQYFVWFFCLLPLILPWSNMKLKWEGLSCIFLWMGAQIHWLMWGYLLEFKGKNVFVQLWLASLLFLAANTWVLIMIIHHHRLSPIFVPFENKVLKNAIKLK
ncbi:hypothetical protein HHK36_023253 [Tetracentron sinense]|uniref:GPI mannosyltransferase 1 n=1 Tax=Tetracentron sinense TaxID=13715 RepID=A0A834YQX4_TETSI|nr:hypothetical protein HHK36_023253 [Tetracentron sinense]